MMRRCSKLIAGFGFRVLLTLLSELILGATPLTASAESCTLTKTTCVDATPCKPIQGLTVCLTTLGQSCWKFEKQYTCYPDAETNSCSILEGTAGCAQYSSVCIGTHPTTGACVKYENRYDCPKPLAAPLPAGVIYLGTEFEIIKDALNESACTPLRTSSTCWKEAGPTCIEPGATRVINGLSVTKECWRYEEKWACEDPAGVAESTCDKLETNPACTEVGSSVCVETLPNGTCSHYERTFQCVLQEGATETVADCSDQKFCMDMGGGNIMCFKSGSPADQDFAQTVTALEMARQMGVYLDPNSLTVFNGTPDKCREGYFGLKQCCETENMGGTTNSATAGAALQFTYQAGKEIVQFLGSSYVHDFLFNSSSTMLSTLSGLYTAGGASYAALASEFTVYGFEFTFSLETGLNYVGFDPVLFAASVAITVALKLMECEQSEQTLSIRRGAGLCEYVGSYCSKKVLGSCVERTKGFCCFNSRLAKIISVDGRKQLGKTFGDPAAPDCSGFTAEELELIDFSAIDFSEFITEVTKNMPDTSHSKSRVTEQMQNYYDYGTTDLNENFYTSGAGLPD